MASQAILGTYDSGDLPGEATMSGVELDGYEGHFENFDSGFTVGFETYTADADLTPAVRRTAGRPLPVRPLGLRHQGEGDLQDGERR